MSEQLYTVEVRKSGIQIVQVIAKSKSEAIRKVKNGEGDDIDYNIDDVYWSTAKAYEVNKVHRVYRE